MMTSLKRRSVRAYRRLSALADYIQLVSIYSIADNCVRVDFGPVVRALDFYPDRPGSNPTTGEIFSAMLHSCYDFHVVRMS